MKYSSRWLIAAWLLIVVASSGCATSPWSNPNPSIPNPTGAPPRRGLFPGMRNRLREMLPGQAAPQQSPVQATNAARPEPSGEAISITVGDE
jgi:hypothetical protein